LIVDVVTLEKRELLTASVLEHTAAVIATHAEVSRTTFHLEKITHAKATARVHAEATRPGTTLKAAVKTTTPTAATRHVVKATTKVAPTRPTAITPKAGPVNTNFLILKKNQATSGPVPGALTPIQLETAYTTSALSVINQGQGMTIGIVDQYNDPNIIPDANVFSAKYNLPIFNSAGGPTLTVYKDTALVSTVTNSPSNADTSGETSLDVEWAHAMAPKANILLVEVPASTSDTEYAAFNKLLHGVQYAASHGAAAVSLSYGNPETNTYGETVGYPSSLYYFDLPGLSILNSTYLSTGAALNTVVTVSSGDSSYPGYPATSPNVIAVGGTALHLTSSGQYSYETAWGGTATNGAGGGGYSAFFSSPTAQSNNGVNVGTFRSTPDVALDADPYTGVSVYDSYGPNASAPWQQIGGTSLASPLFAGIITLAQQDRIAANKPLLTTTQLDSTIYALYNSPAYSTYFHDITLGNNNYYYFGSLSYKGVNATTGYDRATGLGSPIAKTLVPYLASLSFS
jgi:subtilase family serine protease